MFYNIDPRGRFLKTFFGIIYTPSNETIKAKKFYEIGPTVTE